MTNPQNEDDSWEVVPDESQEEQSTPENPRNDNDVVEEPPSTSWWRLRQLPTRAQHLYCAQEELLGRLIPYLQQQEASAGLTLPVAALSWVLTREQVPWFQERHAQLRSLLETRIQRLRIVHKEWPSPAKRRRRWPELNASSSGLHLLTTLNLQNLQQCRTLWLDQVLLSSIEALPPQLRVFRMERAHMPHWPERLEWPSTLTHLKVSHCGLTHRTGWKRLFCDDTVFPHLQVINLSHNDIRSAKLLATVSRACPALREMDLSYNALRHMRRVSVVGSVEHLNLGHNRLTTTRGLEQWRSLQGLFLSHNDLDAPDVAGLGQLPVLKELTLKGNPLTVALDYRVDVWNLLAPSRLRDLRRGATYRDLRDALPVLDEKQASLRELMSLKDRTRALQTVPQPVLRRCSRVRRKVAPVVYVSSDTAVDEAQEEFPSVSFTAEELIESLLPALEEQESVKPTINNEIARMAEASPALTHRVLDSLMERPTNFSTAFVEEALRKKAAEEEAKPRVEPVNYEKDAGVVSVKDPGLDSRSTTSNVEDPAIERADEENASTLATETVTMADKQPTAKLGLKDSAETAASTEASNVMDQTDPLALSHILDDAGPEPALATELDEPTPDTELSTPARQSDKPDSSIETPVSNGSDRYSSTTSDSPDTAARPGPGPFGHRVVSFLEHSTWDETSSRGETTTPQREDCYMTARLLELAEARSKFAEGEAMKQLSVHENLDIYFEHFVFSYKLPPSSQNLDSEADMAQQILESQPKIRMLHCDRPAVERDPLGGRMHAREEFRRVWKEEIVASGKPALRRLTPNRVARYGFHGELLWSAESTSHLKPEAVAEARRMIICFSDSAVYIIMDHDTVSPKLKNQKRAFPWPIPLDACFAEAKWPHALARHSFCDLKSVTIGFGFQRLTLRFANTIAPGDEDFCYILLVSDKMRAVNLLKELQELSQEAKTMSPVINSSDEAPLMIENDDRHDLDAIAMAVAPDSIGVILHYQILKQRWKSGDRGAVRRVVLVADAKIYLLDEDYAGDGSILGHDMPNLGDSLGKTVFRLVDSADLANCVDLQFSNTEPNGLTILITPPHAFQRNHNWRLLCRDRAGAERLAEDLRKAYKAHVQELRAQQSQT